MRHPERILVIRLSSLGDILHALPAVASLRSCFPGARIDWLVEARMKFLLSAATGIDEVIPVDTAAPRDKPLASDSWKSLWRTIAGLRRRRYDVAIDFQGLVKTALLGLASGAPLRLGFGRGLIRERPARWFYHRAVDAGSQPLHVVALNRLLARAAGADGADARFELHAAEAFEAQTASELARLRLLDFVILNPGGGWPTKRWSAARFGALAQRIIERFGMPVLVTTGPGEEELYRQIAAHASGGVHHFAVPFLELIPLIRRARLFVAGDTGPYHLACALGTPTVGIFGPTSPERNGPWSARDASVVRRLPCSFCYGRSCPTGNECMEIAVEEVFEAVARRLETAER